MKKKEIELVLKPRTMKLTLKELAPYQVKDLKDLKNEDWIEHPEYTDYLFSSLGRVKSKDKMVKHNYGGSALKKTRILSQTETEKGYLNVGLTIEGKTKTFRVHRLIAEAFIRNENDKPQVNHIDGNKKNNRVNNLEWSTSAENVRHAWKNGLNKDKVDAKVKEIYGYVKNYSDLKVRVKTPLGFGFILIDNTCLRVIYDNGKIENLIKSIRLWRDDFKLVLRSLSDLTKEIEHNGEIFIPIRVLHLTENNMDASNIGQYYFPSAVGLEDILWITEKLHEWHFDIYNLLENGLAIEINTIEL